MAKISITPYLRKDKAKANSDNLPIYLRVRVEGKESKFSPGLEVSFKNWDKNIKLPKDLILKGKITSKIQELSKYLVNAEFINGEISIDTVKEFFNGKKVQRAEDQSFFDYYEDYIKRGELNRGLEQSTISSYRSTINSLKKFNQHLRLKDLELKTIEKFDIYLKFTAKNNDSTRSNKHKNIQAILGDAIRHDIKIPNGYLLFKSPKVAVRTNFLTDKETDSLIKIRGNYKLKSLERFALQMFIFCIKTGLRISDAHNLKWSQVNLKTNRIHIFQKKTKNNVTAVIDPLVRAILLEFSDGKRNVKSDKRVFEGGPEKDYIRKKVKSICRLVGIKRDIKFHSSRHTFGTSLSKITSVATARVLLGHKSILTTMKYFNDDQGLVDIYAEKNNVKPSEVESDLKD